MKQSCEYTVKIDQFEGPLDLLLYLVNKSEVDISEISVAAITEQYLQYLDIMRDLNINMASEYLYIAAVLIRLKVQELLPDTEEESSDGEDQIMNRQQLIEKIQEYKKFKEAAKSLRLFESEHFGTFSRGLQEELFIGKAEDSAMGTVTLFDLIAAFRRVVERAATADKREGVRFLQPNDVRIDDRIDFILGAVEEGEEIAFDALFGGDTRTMVLVVTFMAILELVKIKRISFRQEEQFGNLYVRKRDQVAAEAVNAISEPVEEK